MTPRQTEIMEALADGSSPQVAAHRLGIRHRTLVNHLTGIYATLDAETLVDAYVKLGWLNVPVVREAHDRRTGDGRRCGNHRT